MKKMVLWIIALATLSAGTLCAQDIAGDWQGTLHASQGPLRIVLKISKADTGGWSAMLYSIDQGGGGIPVTSITLQHSTLRYSIDVIHGSYEGKVSADGASIAGSWTQNNGPWQLDFQRVTKEAAWAIPDPAKGHTQITVEPKFFDGYVGRYQLTPNLILSITRDGDHFYVQATGQERLEVFPESEKEYFARIAPIQITFETGDQHKATGLVLHQAGRNIPAKRILESTAENLKAHCAEIDSMVAAEFAKHSVGSVTVGVVSGDHLLWTNSYGYADMEKHLPADKDTVYRIGSVTKMFTALMLEQLADAGKLHLSDPVEKYFPEVKTVQDRFPDAPPITLVQLATHTSGLSREPDDTDTYVTGPVSDWEKTLIAALPHTHYILEPGTHFSYSNIGYATLGAALSRAAGQPYVEYLPKHIFETLGMAHTTLEQTPEMLPHLSKGYQADESKIDADTPLREHEGRGYKVPNGAIYTTVGDLARFTSFLLGEGPGGVLKTASLGRYQTQMAVPSDFQLTNGYGLGFMVMHRDNYVAFGHSGAVAGYQAALYMNREASVGVIVLANTLGSEALDSNSLALKALDLLAK